MPLGPDPTLAFICSKLSAKLPDGAPDHEAMEQNIADAQKLCLWALLQGMVPYAPHAFFTAFLDDNDAEERELGIEAGIAELKNRDIMLICSVDGFISSGMMREIEFCSRHNIPVTFVPHATVREILAA